MHMCFLHSHVENDSFQENRSKSQRNNILTGDYLE